MVYTQIDILPLQLLLLDKPSSQTSALCVHYCPLLLPPNHGMQAQIFPTRQSKTSKLFFDTQLLFPIRHEILEFCQRLFDFGHCAGTVDEFAVFGVMQLVGYNKGKEGDRFSRARGTFEDRVASRIERLFEVAHVCILFCAGQHRKKREMARTRIDPGVGKEDGQLVDEESTRIRIKDIFRGCTSSLGRLVVAFTR